MNLFQKRAVSLQTIALSTFSLYFGFTVWSVMFNNFAKEVFDISPTQLGIIQSVRELPGLLGFMVGTLALYIAEVKIATWSHKRDIAMGIDLRAISLLLRRSESGIRRRKC